MLHVIIIILTVLVAILLIGIVLIQKSKGGGLSSQFGGGNAMIGVRQTNNFLEKGTWVLAGIICVLSIASAYTMPKLSDSVNIRSKAAPAAKAPGQEQYGKPLQTADQGAGSTSTPAEGTQPQQ